MSQYYSSPMAGNPYCVPLPTPPPHFPCCMVANKFGSPCCTQARDVNAGYSCLQDWAQQNYHGPCEACNQAKNEDLQKKKKKEEGLPWCPLPHLDTRCQPWRPNADLTAFPCCSETKKDGIKWCRQPHTAGFHYIKEYDSYLDPWNQPANLLIAVNTNPEDVVQCCTQAGICCMKDVKPGNYCPHRSVQQGCGEDQLASRFFNTLIKIGSQWGEALSEDKFQELALKVTLAYRTKNICPPFRSIFRAFELSPFDKIRVVILGQDPYPKPGQANGLAFSMQIRAAFPGSSSLQNIFKELGDDIGCPGLLDGWARQGVLLLNSILTVEANKIKSHEDMGWEKFTIAVIKTLACRKKGMVFILWGEDAKDVKMKKWRSWIEKANNERNVECLIIESSHPSSHGDAANKGFFGSKPFSRANQYLKETGQDPIQWDNLGF